jgi:hypothetical protein
MSRYQEAKTRNCPKCNILVEYWWPQSYDRAIRLNSICRKCCSDNLKGKPTWCKGKTGVYSAETLARMSASAKGKHPSEETRAKISLASSRPRPNAKGKKQSLEMRYMRSLLRTGRKHSPETIEKIRIKKLERVRATYTVLVNIILLPAP